MNVQTPTQLPRYIVVSHLSKLNLRRGTVRRRRHPSRPRERRDGLYYSTMQCTFTVHQVRCKVLEPGIQCWAGTFRATCKYVLVQYELCGGEVWDGGRLLAAGKQGREKRPGGQDRKVQPTSRELGQRSSGTLPFPCAVILNRIARSIHVFGFSVWPRSELEK